MIYDDLSFGPDSNFYVRLSRNTAMDVQEDSLEKSYSYALEKLKKPGLQLSTFQKPALREILMVGTSLLDCLQVTASRFCSSVSLIAGII